ncbi:TolC family protein [Rhodothermus profundi]|nr:TolC family protein [Rhodothermus profundi]
MRILTFLIFPLTLYAQPNASIPQLSLSALVQEALQANPALQAARLAAAARGTRPVQVGSLPDPSFEAGYRPLAIGSFEGAAPATFMLMQRLPFPGKLRLDAEAAQLEAEAAAQDADALALRLVFALRATYFELYRLQETRRLIEDFQERLRAFAEAAAVRYEVGQGSQAAVLRVQLEQHRLSRQLLDLQGAWQALYARLIQLTGRTDLPDTVRLEPLTPPAALPQQSIAEAFERHPEALALRLREHRARTLIRRARREYWPDFVIGVGLTDMMRMNQPVAPLSSLDDRLAVRFGVILPLQRARRSARVEETRLEARRLEARYIDLYNRFLSRWQALEERFAADRANLALLEQTLIPEARTTREALLSAYTTGQASYLDLLDAERALFELERQWVNTLTRLLLTQAEAEQLLGLLPSP